MSPDPEASERLLGQSGDQESSRRAFPPYSDEMVDPTPITTNKTTTAASTAAETATASSGTSTTTGRSAYRPNTMAAAAVDVSGASDPVVVPPSSSASTGSSVSLSPLPRTGTGTAGPVVRIGSAVSKIGPQRTTRGTSRRPMLLPVPPEGSAGIGDVNTDDGDEDDVNDDRDGRERYYSQRNRSDGPVLRRDATHLGKSDKQWLPRVTAYCVAEKYRLAEVVQFFESTRAQDRGAEPVRVDECVYTPYSYKIRSRRKRRASRDRTRAQTPVSSSSSWVDGLLIDVSTGTDSETVKSGKDSDANLSLAERTVGRSQFESDLETGRVSVDCSAPVEGVIDGENQEVADERPVKVDDGDDRQDGRPVGQYSDNRHDGPSDRKPTIDAEVHIPEVFVFDYGTVVVWGMTKDEESRLLAELAHFQVDRLGDDKVQVEEFNFYYTHQYQARIYNDFISLQDKKNHMMKLAVSHALSQSVKTSLYEKMVEDAISESKDLPNEIAEKGKVKMSKKDIHRFIGRLFLLRINIHLQGSVLDSPELMWAEPQLEPVYQAVRDYLEMDDRVNLLTDRLIVVADLLSVLKDQLTHSHEEYLEWIVIILIAAEIVVAAINIVVDLYADSN